MSRLRSGCALAITLVVMGCAAPGPDTRPVAGEATTPFDLNGRVLVTYDGRAFSSGVRWSHAAQRDEIWLLSPVGQTLAYILSEAEGATLTAADQKEYRAASVEELTRSALGWELPLGRLRYWVLGETVSGSRADAVEVDSSRRLIALTQDGWRISIVHYPPTEHDGLPRRLDLASGAYQIRLVIDGWRREAAP